VLEAPWLYTLHHLEGASTTQARVSIRWAPPIAGGCDPEGGWRSHRMANLQAGGGAAASARCRLPPFKRTTLGPCLALRAPGRWTSARTICYLRWRHDFSSGSDGCPEDASKFGPSWPVTTLAPTADHRQTGLRSEITGRCCRFLPATPLIAGDPGGPGAWKKPWRAKTSQLENWCGSTATARAMRRNIAFDYNQGVPRPAPSLVDGDTVIVKSQPAIAIQRDAIGAVSQPL